MSILFQAIEMFLAFAGLIWASQLTVGMVKNGFRPKKDIKKQENFIGVMDYQSKKSNETVTIIHMYMTEDGERDYKEFFVNPTWEKQFIASPFKIEMESWKAGGPFPPKFKPVEPLGDMLNRMMKAKMTGKKITVNIKPPEE